MLLMNCYIRNKFCLNQVKNVCKKKKKKRLKFDDTFNILEMTAYEVGKYVSSVGSKNTSGCDGISNKIIMLSLPHIVQHLTHDYNYVSATTVFLQT